MLLPIRMTLTTSTLIQFLGKRFINFSAKFDHYLGDIQSSLFWEVITWFFFLVTFNIDFLLNVAHEIIYAFTAPPIYFWKLCWHPQGRSILDMLKSPDSWNNDGYNDKSQYHNEWSKEEHGHFFRLVQHNRRKDISRKERRSRLHRTQFDGPAKLSFDGSGARHERIKGYDPQLCMFSFYQMDRANMNKCSSNPSKDNDSSTESLEETMALTYYFASTFESAIDIIFCKRPRKPPDD